MDEMPRDGFRHRPFWLLAVLALTLAQTGFALAAFGPERSLAPVLDDRPIMSGRHPLHLYHGWLGASNFHETGSTTCFDPNFQAGYPKTPAFDSGCRPAEFFLVLGGGSFSPQAYKIGMFVCLILIPLAFVTAARGVGLPAGASVLAGVLGTVISWSAPVRRMLDEGELDFLMAGVGALVYVSWLVRYVRWFDIESWIVLAGVSVVGWYAHPVVWIGLAPIVIGCYFVYAPRRELAWHLGLLGIIAAGLAPNLWWLADWYHYWWLAHHSIDQVSLPPWHAMIGTPEDLAAILGSVPFGLVIAGAGVAGLATLWRAGCRCGMGLVAVGSAVAILTARVLACWPKMTPDGPERLAPLALGFLVMPASFGVWKLMQRGRCAALGTAAAAFALLFTALCDGPDRPLARAASLRTEPIALGLSREQEELVELLRMRTTTDARILLDDTFDQSTSWNWTALLPVLTGRAYLGGLDPDAGVDSSFCELRDGKLNGRRLAEWSDAQLSEYARWYNVGWVVCRSPAATERWARLPIAKAVAKQNDGHSVTIFELHRPRSFILAGSAKWSSCEANRITLTDVVPDANGNVILSLHHPPSSLRAYPSYVQVMSSTTTETQDPWSHVCLRPHGPLPRITLVWENP